MLEDTALVLAAGKGTRLGKSMPKGLVSVVGRPLISYALGFLRACGIQHIVLVGGFRFNDLAVTVRALDHSVELVENPRYEEGNILSLKCGIERIQHGGVLLFHADHVFRADIAEQIRGRRRDGMTIFVDHDRTLGDDDMKVATDETKALFRKASKRLSDYSHGYVGITYCGHRMLSAYAKATDAVIRDEGPLVSSERAMQYLADRGVPVRLADVSGSRWLEIDYLEELIQAQTEIAAHPEEYPFLADI